MENQFKNKLKNHKVDWNKEDLLVDLEAALSKRKKPLKRIWFFLFAFSFLLLATYFGINLKNSNESLNAIDQSKIDIENEVDNKASEGITIIRDNEDIKIGNENFTSNKTDLEPSSGVVDNSNISQTKNSDNEFVGSSIEVHPLQNNLSIEKVKPDHLASINLTKNTDQKNSSPRITKLNSHIGYPSSSLQNSQNSQASITKSKKSYSGNTKERSQNIELADLPKINSFLIYKVSPILLVNTPQLSEENIREPKKVSFYIEPNLSVGFLQRKFSTGITSESYLNYLEEKKTFEKPILHDAISLEFGALIDEKWSVQIGVEYQEMREKLVGDFFSELDSTRVDDHYNTHRYLDIPFNIGRRFSLNNTLLQASAGVSYAITHDFTGRTYGFGGSIEDEHFFRIENRLGFQLGLALEHSISDNKQLFLKTIFRKSPTLGFDEISEKSHLSYSLGVGVRFYIGSRSI